MEPQKTNNKDNEPTIEVNLQDTPVDQPTAGQSFSPSGAVEPTPQVIASTAPMTTTDPGSMATASFNAQTPPISAPIQSESVTAAQPGVFNPAGVTVTGAGRGKKRRRLVFVVALLALVVVLGGGYTFAFYLPNTPANIFKHGLSNTGLAYDKLTDYATTVSNVKYKGVKATGTMAIDAAGISGDGSFSFQNNGVNGTGKINLDLAGEKLDANIRSIQASGQKEPDVYFQVNGIKTVLDKYGLTTLDAYDGKWISVDHTLIKSVADSMTQSGSADVSVPTPAQVQDALAKVGKVNNQYLFKADTGHAVLEQKKYLGKSTFEGRSVYGYQVGYNKTHLQAYVAALSDALDSSSLNTWSKAANDGKSLSATLQVSELKKQVASAKESYTFSMYVDAQTKLVANVHFTGDKATDTFDIGQTYKGGDVYPFVFKIASDSTTDGKDALILNLSLNSKTNEVTVGATFNSTSDGSTTKLSLNAKVTPSNDTVNVTTPVGATPINNVIAQLGLLGGSGDSSSSDLDSSSQSALDSGLGSDLFTLTQ